MEKYFHFFMIQTASEAWSLKKIMQWSSGFARNGEESMRNFIRVFEVTPA